MELPFYVVDAFAAEPFHGNPAAVVFEAEGLNDAQLSAIAAEFNHSETTFVLPPTPKVLALHGKAGNFPVRFRWFTPANEVKMCGHATVAGIQAMLEAGRLPRPAGTDSIRLPIETLSGVLSGFVEASPGVANRFMIWLDLVDPVLRPQRLDTSEIGPALGLEADAFSDSLPFVRTQDDDVIAFVRNVAQLNDSQPDFGALKRLLNRERIRGLSLATTGTLTPSVHVQSRFFAPCVGINEDPVTGSVHGPLAVFLVQRGHVPLHDGIAGLTCVQGRAGGRAGVLHALVQAKPGGTYAVRIGGRAVTTMRGTLVA